MKYLYTMLLCCILALPGQAQQDSTAKSSLMLAAIYGSTANYFGQTTTERLPYVMSYGAYRLKGGLYFAASALTLLNDASGVAAIDLSAGYGFSPVKNLEGNFSYTRSFYQENVPLLQASNENNVNGELAFTHFLKSSVSADYAFGTLADVFVSFTNSKLISLGSFGANDLISIEPAFSVIGGTQHFYQTYTTEKNRKAKFLDPLFPGNKPEPETTTVESTKFDLLAYTLAIPVSYNRSNYGIEAAYQATVAGKELEGRSDKPVSIFNLSIYYMF
ncbi:hypothetical protein GZH53_12825 [Flavihumibacter sp. R14]|nr:hypothetical protein [Flavihumibacter soli]